jgi:hypothetical protein
MSPNGLSWEYMLTKNRVERMDGTFERYFLPEHLRASSNKIVAWTNTESRKPTSSTPSRAKQRFANWRMLGGR